MNVPSHTYTHIFIFLFGRHQQQTSNLMQSRHITSGGVSQQFSLCSDRFCASVMFFSIDFLIDLLLMYMYVYMYDGYR